MVTTSVPGVTVDKSVLMLSANVHIHVLSSCEHVLTLSDVSLKDVDPSLGSQEHVTQAYEFKRALQERALRFGFADGRIDGVCPDPEEKTWVLNIKRGIISAFQNTMDSFNTDKITTETDVSGECEVSYEQRTGSVGLYRLRKTKNLRQCSGRQYSNILQGVPYKVQSSVQSAPILGGSHQCEQEISTDGLLTKASCKETHVFQPFSQDNSGATTEVEYTLTFTREKESTMDTQGSVQRRTCLKFERPSPVDITEEAESELNAEFILRHICEQTSEDIRPDTPSAFTNLVHKLRKLDTGRLRTLYSDIVNNNFCPKAASFFRDAIPSIGTTASMTLMREMIVNNVVTDTQASMWLTSLAFIREPTKEMLSELKPLLETELPSRKAALSISSLVNSYCRQRADCSDDDAVRQIIDIFIDNLNYNCKSTSDTQHDKILMSLKAIGNAGYAEQATETLNRCFQDSENPMAVRVAAVNAFRKMACTAPREGLYDTFTDIKQDSELRINTYLSLMQCAEGSLLDKVQETLAREEINQVGSFVWTHLTNLVETSSPLKQDIRRILEDVELQKTFNLDQRKYSRNVEWSTFSEQTNTGVTVDSNLIWSGESFVPRSGSMNLTAELFGQSVNLLEVGGRVEGIDAILEDMFVEAERKNDIQRNKRSAIKPDSFDNIDQRFRKESRDPRGSYYIRLFGNEIRYDDFHGLDLSTLKDRLSFLEWVLSIAEQHNVDVTKSVMFLEGELVEPTAIGLPLRLTVEGAAVMELKVQGTTRLGLMASPPSLDINGSFKPSGALEVRGEMGVDAFVARTGLKLVNTLHTSNVIQGKIQLLDGNKFNFDIDMPRDQIDLFNAESNVYITYRDQEHEQMMQTEGRTQKSECTDSGLSKVLGVELCTEMSWPPAPAPGTPRFPLNGPAKFSLSLNKKDTFDTYHFEAMASREQVRGQYKYATKISFNTPGSQVDRELTFNFLLDIPNLTMRFDIRSPWKKLDVSSSRVGTNDLKRLVVQALIDETYEYSLMTEIQQEISRESLKFNPVIELVIPERDPITLTGQVLYKSKKKLEVQFHLANLLQEPIALTGSMNKKQNGYFTDISLTSSMGSAHVNGYLELARARRQMSSSSRLEFKYQLPESAEENIAITHSMNHQRGSPYQTELTGTLTSSLWKAYDSDFSLEFSKGPTTVRTALTVGLIDDQERRVTITQSSTMDWQNAKTIQGEIGFQYPAKNWNYGSKVNVAWPEERMTADASIQYPGSVITYNQFLEKMSEGVYHHEMRTQLPDGAAIHLMSDHVLQPRHEVTAELTTPWTENVRLEGHLTPQLMDFDGRVLIGYGTREYSAESTWNVQMAENDMSGQAEITLKSPEFTSDTKGSATRQNNIIRANVETELDINGYEKKTMATSGEITISSMTPSLTLKTTWSPDNFVQIEGNAAYILQGRRPTSLEGKVYLTSSFPGVEKWGISMSHKRESTGIANQAAISWQDKTIEGGYTMKNRGDWTKMETEFEIKTPFQPLQVLTYKMMYNLQGDDLTASLNAQYNEMPVNLVVSGTADLKRRSLQGDLTFTSPFPYVQKLSLNGRHNDNGRTFNSQLDASWADDSSVLIVLDMQHEQQGWQVDNSGHLTTTLSLPSQPPNVNTLSWEHHNTQSNIVSHVELLYGEEKSEVDISASKTKEGRMQKSTISAALKTPFEYARDLSFTFSRQHAKKWWRDARDELEIGWAPGQSITIVGEMDVNPKTNSMTIKSAIRTPLEGYESMSLNAENKKQGDRYLLNNELTWGADQKVSLDGEVTINGVLFNGELRFLSPFSPIERMVLIASNAKEQATWVSIASLEYAPEQKIEVETKLGTEDMKRFNIDIKTPFPGYTRMVLDLEHQGTLRDFSSKAKVESEQLGGQATLELSLDTSSLSDIKGQFDFTSPLAAAPFARGSLGHKVTGRRTKTDINLELPDHTHVLSNDVTFASWNDFTAKTNMNLAPGFTFENDITINENSGQGKMKLVTPFTALQLFETEFEHNGQLLDFRNSGFVVLNDARYTGSTEFKLVDTDVDIKVSLTLPGLLEAAAAIKHTGGTWREFRNSGSFIINGKEYTTNSEFSLNSPDITLGISSSFDVGDVEYSGKLKFNFAESLLSANLAFHIPEEYSIQFTHAGPIVDFTDELALKGFGESVSVTAKFQMTNLNFEGTLNLESSVDAIENLEVVFSNRGRPTTWHQKVDVKYGTSEGSLKSSFIKEDSMVKGSLEILTPFEYIRDLMIQLNHDGATWQEFKTSGFVQYNNARYSGSTEFKYAPALVRLISLIQIPQEYSITLNHEGELDIFANSLVIKYDTQSITAESAFRKQESSIEGSAKVLTPFENYEELSGNFKHTGPVTNSRQEAVFNIFGQTINANSEVNIAENNALVSATVEQTFTSPEYQQFSINVNHDGSYTDFRQEASAGFPDRKVNLVTTFRLDGERLNTVVEMTTPFTEVGLVKTDVAHEGAWTKFTNRATVQVNDYTVEASSKLRVGVNKVRGGASFKIPSAEYDISFNHKGAIHDFTNTITATVGEDETNINSAFKLADEGLQTYVNIRTPYEGYDNMRFDVNYEVTDSVITTIVTVTTPFEGYENTKFENIYRGEPTSFVWNANAEYNRKHLKANASYTNTREMFVLGGKLQTPLIELADIGFNITKSIVMNGFDATSSFLLNGKTKSGIVKFQQGVDGFITSGELDIPFIENENLKFSLNHQGPLTNFQTVANLQLPLQDYRSYNLEVTHQGTSDEFTTTLKTETPFTSLPATMISVTHKGSLTDFTTAITTEYLDQRVGAEVSYQKTSGWSDTQHKASFKISSTHEIIQNAQLNIDHRQRTGAFSGNIIAIYNSIRHVDAEYTLEYGSGKMVSIELRQPSPFSASVRLTTNYDEVIIDANMNYANQPRQVLVTFTSRKDTDLTKRGVALQATLPERSVVFNWNYELTAEKFLHKCEVKWGEEPSQNFSWELETTMAATEEQRTFNGHLMVTSEPVTLRWTMVHEATPGSRYVTEVMADNLRLRSELVTREPGLRDYQMTLSATHPSLTNDVIVTVDGIRRPEVPHYNGNINVQFGEQTVQFSGKIADESTDYNTRKLVAECTLKHPASLLDFQFGSRVAYSREKWSSSMEADYMTSADQQKKHMQFRADIDHTKREAALEIITPVKSISLTSSSAGSGGVLQSLVTGIVDEKEVRAELNLDRGQRSADLKIFYNEDDMMHTYGKYVDATKVKIVSYRQQSGERIQDAELNLDMDLDRILNAHALIRPSLFTDIQGLMAEDSGLMQLVGTVSAAVAEDWQYKLAVWTEIAQPLIEVLNTAKTKLQATYDMLKAKVLEIYETDAFNIKTMYDTVIQYYEQIRSCISEYMDKFKTMYEETMTTLKTMYEEYSAYVMGVYQQWLAVAQEKYNMFATTVQQKWQEFYGQLHATIEGIVESIKEHPELQYWVEQTRRIAEDWQEQIVQYFSALKQQVAEFRASVQQQFATISEHPYLQAIKEWVDTIGNYINWPELSFDIIEELKKFLETLKIDWPDFDIEKAMENATETLQENGLDKAHERVWQWIQDSFKFNRNRVITWDVEAGEFEVEMYVPSLTSQVSSSYLMKLRQYLEQANDLFSSSMPISQADWSLYDTFYKYKPSKDMANWIPPFKVHATLAGNQHYMTFDKRFYEFAGDCSYLLARDFLDGKFSVVVNYERTDGKSTKKSITVMLGDVQLEISPLFKVLLGGERAELPLFVENTIVRRIGNSIRVDNKNGITVLCDLPHDRCTVNMTGWYYGRTGGLFGTYDYEPATDFTTADRTWATNAADMAASWTIGDQCGVANNAQEQQTTTEEVHDKCHKYFMDERSPFRMCFAQVNNTEFMNMCLIDASGGDDSQKAVCDMASFYVDECKRAGVPLRVPNECVTCELLDGGVIHEHGEQQLKDDAIPQSADVVFVVSYENCHQDTTGHLRSIIGQVERNLQARGFTNNRFGLVGASGAPGGATYSHTIDSELFNTRDAIDNALQNMIFGEGGSGNEDPMGGVHLAVGYPFRAGVSKSIILLPCTACHENTIQYSELQQLLFQRDIRLHTLLRHNFRLKTNSPKTKSIFGMDPEGIYTHKHVDDPTLTGDRVLRNQAYRPKDLCAALSEETNGTVFNVLKLTKSNRATQKKFLDVYSRLVAKKGTPTECQICHCQADDVGAGHVVCRNCKAREETYGRLPNDFSSEFPEGDFPSISELEAAYEQDSESKRSRYRKSE